MDRHTLLRPAVGFLNQTRINVLEVAWRGEMGRHGVDLCGNSVSGLVFCEACPDPLAGHIIWGGSRFCFETCYQRFPDADSAQKGVFDVCERDNMNSVRT